MVGRLRLIVRMSTDSGGDCYCVGIIDHLLMMTVLLSAKTGLLTCRTRVVVVGRDLYLMEIHRPSYDDVANDVVNCVDDESFRWLFVQALKLLSMNLFCSLRPSTMACLAFLRTLGHGRLSLLYSGLKAFSPGH
jgi:hypothetical protein